MKRCTARTLTAFTCLLLGSQVCQAESDREGLWLDYLQQGQTEGMAMPRTLHGEEEMISLSQADIKRLLGARNTSSHKRSKLQFSKLNYQADMGDKSLQLRMFYQF